MEVRHVGGDKWKRGTLVGHGFLEGTPKRKHMDVRRTSRVLFLESILESVLESMEGEDDNNF